MLYKRIYTSDTQARYTVHMASIRGQRYSVSVVATSEADAREKALAKNDGRVIQVTKQ